MSDLPALSIAEPYASAILAGIKTFETRSLPPNGEMRPDGVTGFPGVRLARGGRIMVIANAKRPEGEWFGEYMLGEWTDDEVRHVGGVHPDECELCPDPGDGLMDPACVALNDLRPALLNDEGAHGVSLAMYLHPGHIVGSVTVTDALPIVADCDDLPDAPPLIETLGEPLRMWPEGAMDLSESVDISDQLSWGDWRPGRWAWQLADPKTTNEMCPVCLGYGGRWAGNAPDETDDYLPCAACHGDGQCDPIPVRGHQGLRPLTPEQLR